MTMPNRRSLIAATLSLAMVAMGHGVARADELADIKAAGVLNVGVFADFPPFASAGSDMTLHGYDIDVANALGEALGVKVKLVPITGQNRTSCSASAKAPNARRSSTSPTPMPRTTSPSSDRAQPPSKAPPTSPASPSRSIAAPWRTRR
jgi:hypothetical protein